MSDLPFTAAGNGAPGAFAAGRATTGAYRAVSLLIEEQAARTPDRPAVAYRDATLDYRAVHRLGNGLAAELSAAGVRRGMLVPLTLVNGLELPLTLIALHRLGAAFVLCDPAWPADRMKAAMAALDPELLLGADHPGAAGIRAHPVSLDRIVPSDRSPGAAAPGPADPAYGVFTSGTTGTPKCAVNLHRGLTNRFAFMTRYFAADGGEVVLQNSRHTFDSVDLAAALAADHRRPHRDPRRRASSSTWSAPSPPSRRTRVTITDFVPSDLRRAGVDGGRRPGRARAHQDTASPHRRRRGGQPAGGAPADGAAARASGDQRLRADRGVHRDGLPPGHRRRRRPRSAGPADRQLPRRGGRRRPASGAAGRDRRDRHRRRLPRRRLPR